MTRIFIALFDLKTNYKVLHLDQNKKYLFYPF